MPKTVTRIEQPKAAYRKRVAAYCRVSTDHEAQLDSLENQMETFRYRAAQRGDWDLVNIYADDFNTVSATFECGVSPTRIVLNPSWVIYNY